MDFWPAWRYRETHCASLHNRKDNKKFKNTKQPELTLNQTVWKSDNQGVKEETFIQTGSRGRDRKSGWKGRMTGQQQADQARQPLLEGAVHIYMCINWEEQLGSKTDQATQGSSARK